MPEPPSASASGAGPKLSNSQSGSHPLKAEDEQPAKRPRLSTDGHGPTLSSSYRPRKRPDPIPTHISIPQSSSTTTTSSSSSSNFPSEHIITPSSSSSTPANFQQNNHYRPTSSSSSSYPAIPPISSLVSTWPFSKPSLPPPPFTHALPPRPQVSLPPPNSNRVEPPSGVGAVPISPLPLDSPRNDTSVKAETIRASTSPELDEPNADEIRRRADEVIARLMGTAPPASSTTAAPALSTSVEGSLERKAEDVIARLEREARAREAAVPPVMFRPHYPPYGIPGQPPTAYYPPVGSMRPPPPPSGWRPPVGYGPPPGWRPPGPTITRFPRPPPALPPAHTPSHLSPPNRPPFLPPAVSPTTSTATIPSLSTFSAPIPAGTPNTNAEIPILLPKKRKSESLEPPVVGPKPQNQVYIGNLPADTQLATLRKAFEALSPILTIELRAPYAMIEFEEDGMAQQAVEVYDEGSFGGVQIRVERASD